MADPRPPRLQPLRVPAGWRIDWNKLCPIEPSPENVGHFAGSTHFSAINESRRFWIDVEWQPEFDPAGEYVLRVAYQPWPRTPSGRRRHDVALRFDVDAQLMHELRTREFVALVEQLEHLLEKCCRWTVEAN